MPGVSEEGQSLGEAERGSGPGGAVLGSATVESSAVVQIQTQDRFKTSLPSRPLAICRTPMWLIKLSDRLKFPNILCQCEKINYALNTLKAKENLRKRLFFPHVS